LLSGVPRRSAPQRRPGPGPSLEVSPGSALQVRGHASRTMGVSDAPDLGVNRKEAGPRLDRRSARAVPSPRRTRINGCGKRSRRSRGERIERSATDRSRRGHVTTTGGRAGRPPVRIFWPFLAERNRGVYFGRKSVNSATSTTRPRRDDSTAAKVSARLLMCSTTHVLGRRFSRTAARNSASE